MPSPEKQRADAAARVRLCRQRKHDSMSAEERSDQKAKKAAAARLYRQRKNASMSAEERDAQKAKKAAAARLYRQRKNASMSAEERDAQKAKKAAAARLYRQRQQTNAMSAEESSCDYEIVVDKTHPVQQARNHDQKKIMKVDSNPNVFRAAVCVLCDRLIIGCEEIHKITVESLRSQKNRISVKSYEDHHQVTRTPKSDQFSTCWVTNQMQRSIQCSEENHLKVK